MNKDVIYIEPEDDITDIIAKIEKSKEKIVALVPPKKAGVFRSLVNIKLIAKAGTTAEKSVVLVTVDPSITKLAAATKIPVAKNLQSAPAIPEINSEDTTDEQTIEDVSDPEEEAEEEPEEPEKPEKSEKKAKKVEDDPEEEDEEEDEEDEEEEKPIQKPKKKKPLKLSGNKILDWIKLHKKLSIAGGVVLVALIGFLIWAFGFAPAVDITVAIKTDQKNFSESITFVDNLADENAKEGKFYLEQKKIENTQEVTFEATGQKNVGQKASGDLAVAVYFPYNNYGLVVISQGDKFSISGLTYTADGTVKLEYSGNGKDGCLNKDNDSELVNKGCKIMKHVAVSATEPGAKYNIAASTVGWSTSAPVDVVSSEKAMAGGTDDIKTVVQQSDIEKAKAELTSGKEEEDKTKLYETIDDNEYFIIDSTFEQTTSKAEATPAVDQEVSGDTKPVLKATTTISVYVINESKLKEYIETKADLKENQKVFDIRDIYIENFDKSDKSGSAKLKAQYFIGPKITEAEIVDMVKGKGLGDASREIRDIEGVSSEGTRIDPSYPWVMVVPGDSNRITVKFEVKDQEGNEIKAQDENDNSDENNDNSDEQKSEEKSDKKEEK